MTSSIGKGDTVDSIFGVESVPTFSESAWDNLYEEDNAGGDEEVCQFMKKFQTHLYSNSHFRPTA